jgi:hypothetical protein
LQDSQEVSDEEWLANILGQWDLIVNTTNKSTSLVRRLQLVIGDNLDSLETRLVGIKANLGKVSANSAFDNCILAWDGLLLLHNKVEAISSVNDSVQEALHPREQAEHKIKKSLSDVESELLRWLVYEWHRAHHHGIQSWSLLGVMVVMES